MKVNGEHKRICVRTAAGAAVLSAICAAGALAQGTDQKPAGNYQTFYLNNSTGQRDANDITTDLRNMLPMAKMYYVSTENALSIRGSAEDIATAQKILADIDRPQKTYRVTYTISEGGSGQGVAQRFVLMVTPGSKTYSKQGTRVPIVTGQYNTEQTIQNTQVQYLDVGVNIEASLDGYGDGLRLHTKVEETSVAEEKSGVGTQDPIIHQSVLEGSSAIALSKPVVLGSIEMPGNGRHMEVQVVAELAR